MRSFPPALTNGVCPQRRDLKAAIRFLRKALAQLLPQPKYPVFDVARLIHERLPDEAERKSHEAGWTKLLDKLRIFLEDEE